MYIKYDPITLLGTYILACAPYHRDHMLRAKSFVLGIRLDALEQFTQSPNAKGIWARWQIYASSFSYLALATDSLGVLEHGQHEVSDGLSSPLHSWSVETLCQAKKHDPVLAVVGDWVKMAELLRNSNKPNRTLCYPVMLGKSTVYRCMMDC